jgi:hypothetical protein
VNANQNLLISIKFTSNRGLALSKDHDLLEWSLNESILLFSNIKILRIRKIQYIKKIRKEK